jgi:hypothetical protein
MATTLFVLDTKITHNSAQYVACVMHVPSVTFLNIKAFTDCRFLHVTGIATQTILTIPVNHVTSGQMVNLALSNGQVVTTTLANLQTLAQPHHLLAPASAAAAAAAAAAAVSTSE